MDKKLIMFSIFNKKRKFFKKKISDVQKSIWDMEFKIDKSKQVREGVRMDRDRAMEALNQVTVQLKNKDITKEQKEKFESDKAHIEDTIKRYERQIQMIDEQIEGVAPTNDNPGVAGIRDTVKSLVELKSMLKDYLRKI